MRRVALSLSMLAIVLGTSSAASAGGGPVFVVVPSAGQEQSVRQAVAVALKSMRVRLASADRERLRTSAQLARAHAALAGSSDPFPAQERVVLLTKADAVARARIATLRASIQRLQLALRPVQLPAGFSSQPASAVGSYAVQVAQRYLGVRYLWGGAAPDTGFDCSGFVQYVYAKLGIDLPHYAASQFTRTRHVALAQIEPGDLVFFEPRADGPGHVGMYVGEGRFIEAPHTGDVVKIESLSDAAVRLGFVGVTRPTA
jgi:cell wall-associated NlpC family hydrolase